MPNIKGINDPEVLSIISGTTREFHKSPIAWEDKLLYFLLPDRFSDNQESGYLDAVGQLVTGSSESIYQPGDNGNALDGRDGGSTKRWLDAGAKFVGGNLNGLISKLGYLKRLGVTALWVGPIFKQVKNLETYHGYGVQNFLDVDPRFGTREDLQNLVKKAHDHGIFVLLDIILNHSGNVFSYVTDNPSYNNGQTYEVEGYYDANRNPILPFGVVDEAQYPSVFPDGAIWPREMQAGNCFTQQGHINNWDSSPEFLDGDFFDLKDIKLGVDDPNMFTPQPALQILCQVYKFWIAFADIDGYRIDTVKHMGIGPTRHFAAAMHEYAATLGKDNFLLIGEITGGNVHQTMELTGLDAALGIGGVQASLWQLPKGYVAPSDYFDLFRNARYLKRGTHTWIRNKIITMVDDHDQVWRGNSKARFASEGPGGKLVLAALAMNLCTLGIPCIYYGSEQGFDGQGGNDGRGHSADQYIREAMFGGEFGAFRSRGKHCFDESNTIYVEVGKVANVRNQEIALRRGRQYLREISGDGVHFGLPYRMGDRIKSVVAWSRIIDNVEVLCALNTDEANVSSAWITVDSGIHPSGSVLKNLYVYPAGQGTQTSVTVETRNGRSVVQLTVPPAGFVIYK
ncbi:alpha-amylase [Leptodontidium sp. MPI-SDFR-AT-0119]|nr:alpha-amylase [Leptodontidium sp. MPI-SDFR-AT-0119]